MKRFASAVLVGAILICAGTLLLPLTGIAPESRYLVTSIWCAIPVIWGIWFVLMPKTWKTSRIPLWGAILGLIAGVLIIFIVQLPNQILEETISLSLQISLVMGAILLYYLLWHLVARTYSSVSQT